MSSPDKEFRLRSFNEWKAQVIAYLLKIEPRSNEMRQQLDTIILKFHSLRARWLSTGLLYLWKFTDHWGVQLPTSLIPTSEEIEMWFKLNE